jgi:hypothetical protein
MVILSAEGKEKRAEKGGKRKIIALGAVADYVLLLLLLSPLYMFFLLVLVFFVMLYFINK